MNDKFRALIMSCLLAVGCAAGPATAYAGEILIGVGSSETTPQTTGSSVPQKENQGSAGTSAGSGNTENAGNTGNTGTGNLEPAMDYNASRGSGTGSSGAMSSNAIAEEESWSLILVNKTHPIPEGYEVPELTELANNNYVDSRVYPYLQKMFDDARAQGIYPHINSSYRTHEKQQSLMDEKVQEYLWAGYSQEEAEKQAKDWVAIPGTSEHELGLSLDISTADSNSQDAGTVWWWLKEYCSNYGFILRYPEDKTDITGISNEPWHFRYVGEHAAKEIMSQGLCLEEYLGEVN